MFLRILKRDLKRKKTMNIIILLFVVLTSVFVASGLNNIITIANGTDYFFDKAGIGDYIAVRKDDETTTEKFDSYLPSISAIKSYRAEEIYFTSPSNFSRENGKKIEIENTIMVQSIEGSKLNFFDSNNNVINTLQAGHCYTTYDFVKNSDIKVGETIKFNANGTTLNLVYDGFLKDALFGSELMDNARFFINDAEYQSIRPTESTSSLCIGEIAYIDTDDVGAVDNALSTRSGIMSKITRSMLKTAYIMNMVVAFIILILSVCLIIVSFVILKSTISFTITEEYREIGVMKAIGIKNFKIRCLYLAKYLFIAIVGTVIGFALSFPFENLLIKSVSKVMVLGNSFGVWPNIVGSLLVILSIIGFAYLATSKVKKATPVDAIRSGQTGERFKKKTKLKLSKSNAGSVTFMACNDVLSSKKKYIGIASVFALCTLFVMVLSNTASTINGDGLIDTLGCRSDLYYADVDKAMSFMHDGGNAELDTYLRETEEKLANANMPGKVRVDVLFPCKVTVNGQEYSLNAQQGKGNFTTNYVYSEGSAPKNKDEIAITPIVSELINAHIGDTVIVDYGAGQRNVIISAYYESMNQLGEMIRLHEEAPTNLKDCGSWISFEIKFADSPSKKTIEERKQKVKECLNVTEVSNATEFQKDCIGVSDTLDLVKILLLGIIVVVIILIVVLMECSFISQEKSEIAILKAVGFKDRKIIWYHVLRFVITSIVAVLVAAALSVPVTYLTIGPIFKIMGLSKITFVINPLEILVIYPLLIAGVTLLVSFITALTTKTIKSSDTASIE